MYQGKERGIGLRKSLESQFREGLLARRSATRPERQKRLKARPFEGKYVMHSQYRPEGMRQVHTPTD